MSRDKSQQLYLALKQALAAWPAGTRLPSVRELMTRHQVSQATVDRAFLKLKQEKLIETRVGDGTYTCHPPAMSADSLSLCLLVTDYPSEFARRVARDLGECFQAAGHRVERVFYDWRERPWRQVARGEWDAVALLPAPQLLAGGELIELAERQPKLILLDLAPPPGCRADSVATDNQFAGALAAEHLLGLGHRRLAVLACEPMLSSSLDRIHGFCNHALLSAGVQAQVIDCRTTLGENSTAHAYAALRQRLAAGPPDFTGLFAVSDGGALGALKVMHESGRQLPAELSLVGCDDVPEAAYFHPGLTTLRQNLTGWAEAVIELTRRRKAEPDASQQHLRVKPTLIERESTCPPPEAASRTITGKRSETHRLSQRNAVKR